MKWKSFKNSLPNIGETIEVEYIDPFDSKFRRKKYPYLLKPYKDGAFRKYEILTKKEWMPEFHLTGGSFKWFWRYKKISKDPASVKKFTWDDICIAVLFGWILGIIFTVVSVFLGWLDFSMFY